MPSSEGLGITDAKLQELCRTRLNGIVDPCSAATAVPAGIVDMGLIREISFLPGPGDGAGYACRVRLCVTHPFCMMAAAFLREITESLKLLPHIGEVSVELDHRVIWTEALMSPEYRAKLDAHRRTKMKDRSNYRAKSAVD